MHHTISHLPGAAAGACILTTLGAADWAGELCMGSVAEVAGAAVELIEGVGDSLSSSEAVDCLCAAEKNTKTQ